MREQGPPLSQLGTEAFEERGRIPRPPIWGGNTNGETPLRTATQFFTGAMSGMEGNTRHVVASGVSGRHILVVQDPSAWVERAPGRRPGRREASQHCTYVITVGRRGDSANRHKKGPLWCRVPSDRVYPV